MQIQLGSKKDPIEKTIKGITCKLWFEKIINYLCLGFTAFAVITLLFVVISKFFNIIFLEHKILKVFIGVLIISLSIGIFSKPSLKDGAMAGDLLGLKDRLVTYLEFKDEENAVIAIFIEDLKERLSNANFTDKYKISFDIKRVLISILILCLSGVIILLPSNQRKITKQIEKNHEIIKDEAKNISLLKKDVTENFNGKEKDAVVKILEKLEKELEKTFDIKDAALKVDAAQGQIEDVFDESSSIFQRQPDGFAKENVDDMKSETGDVLSDSSLAHENQEREVDAIEKSITNIPKNSISKEKMGKATSEKTGNKDIDNKTYDDKKERKGKLEDDVISSLQESKERLASKAYDGTKTKGGKDQLSDFALGEKDEYKEGESSSSSSKDKMSGGSGRQSAKDPDAVGQGKDRAFGKSDSKAEFSDKNKGNSSENNLKSEGTDVQITGQKDNTGRMLQDKKGEVASKKGDTPLGNQSIGDFTCQDFDYVINKRIPRNKRKLVIKYFNLLKGAKGNGR